MTVRAKKALGQPTTSARSAQGGWLPTIPRNWPRAVCQLLERGEPAVVRIVIANVLGSAPREPGTCMLVSAGGTLGTIGGGNLEWQAIRAAQALGAGAPFLPGSPPLADALRPAGEAAYLRAPASAGAPSVACEPMLGNNGGAIGPSASVSLRRLVLGRQLSQCCGGVVQLWLERFTHADLPFLEGAAQAVADALDAALMTEVSGATVTRRLLQTGEAPSHTRIRFTASDDQHATLLEQIGPAAPAVWLFGAGHVGQGLIQVLAGLPFEITWIDSRAELLPAELPDNAHPLCVRDPVSTVAKSPAGAYYLVMTHDHALDYALCREILCKGDFGWLGLIGSRSKGARFRSRLARDGIAAETIERLTCPIGLDGIDSKLPAAIAVGVAAQLLQVVQVQDTADTLAQPADRTTADATMLPAVETAAREREPTAPAAALDLADDCSSRDCANCRAHEHHS